MKMMAIERGYQDGHVSSWQQRDVNLPPDPVLKITAVASVALFADRRSLVHRKKLTHTAVIRPAQAIGNRGRHIDLVIT